jgi:hypothetical protein
MWLLSAGILIGAVTILLFREGKKAWSAAVAQHRRRREIVRKTSFVVDEIGRLIATRHHQAAGR